MTNAPTASAPKTLNVHGELREINVTQALTYSFRVHNLINMLVLPGLVALAMAFWGLRPSVYRGLGESSNSLKYQQLLTLFPWIALLVVLPAFLGYGWHLMRVLHKNGYDSSAPDWTLEQCIGAWWGGLKVLALLGISVVLLYSNVNLNLQSQLAASLCNAPSAIEDFKPLISLLAAIPSLLLLPFVWAMLIQPNKLRSLKDLLSNFRRSIRIGFKCYGKSFLASIVVGIVFPTVFVVFMNSLAENCQEYICLLGPVFVLMLFASFHLIAQAYDAYRED